MPVSRTANATTCRAASSVGTPKYRARPAPGAMLQRRPSPVSVNLTALESRLRRICCSRWASVMIDVGQVGGDLDPQLQALLLGLRAERLLDVAAHAVEVAPGPASTSIRPASILDRSRMSSISRSRSEPALWMVRANSICLSVRLWSGLSASSRASSSSELSGVRSSWLMLARNSDLYWLARASCCAFSSRPSRASSISRFLISMLRFCSDEQLRLLLQLGVGALQLGRLVLQLPGQPLGLGEQLLGAPVGLDGVERDADRWPPAAPGRPGAASENARDRARTRSRRALALEQHRQHDQVAPGRGRPEPGADRSGSPPATCSTRIVRREAAAWPTSPSPGAEGQPRSPGGRRSRTASAQRAAASSTSPVGSVGQEERAELRVDQRGHLVMIMRQTSPRSRWPCSRPPMRARLESSQPCSAFVLVVSRRVDDHLVDVVLELGDLALRLDRDLLGQVAAGHRGGHLRRSRAAGW